MHSLLKKQKTMRRLLLAMLVLAALVALASLLLAISGGTTKREGCPTGKVSASLPSNTKQVPDRQARLLSVASDRKEVR